MGKTNFSKIKLLKIWEILKQESDEDRPLTTSMIIERLADHGISCDRRTLYADINELIKNGYDIKYRHGQHSNLYYIEKRAFDIPELRILMDAVQAANFITEQKSAELIDKIAALGGSNQAKLLKSNIVEFNTATTAWGDVPSQDYFEDWWSKSIAEIDECLFKKYNVPSDIAEFVRKNIQTKDESNIVNLQ